MGLVQNTLLMGVVMVTSRPPWSVKVRVPADAPVEGAPSPPVVAVVASAVDAAVDSGDCCETEVVESDPQPHTARLSITRTRPMISTVAAEAAPCRDLSRFISLLSPQLDVGVGAAMPHDTTASITVTEERNPDSAASWTPRYLRSSPAQDANESPDVDSAVRLSSRN